MTTFPDDALLFGHSPSDTLIPATAGSRETLGSDRFTIQYHATRTQYLPKSQYVRMFTGFLGALVKNRRYCVGLIDVSKHVGQMSKLVKRRSFMRSQSSLPCEGCVRGQNPNAGVWLFAAGPVG